jgi:TonB family protein
MLVWIFTAALSAASVPTEFAMTRAQWWALCPNVITSKQLERRGIEVKPIETVPPRYPVVTEAYDADVQAELRVATNGQVVDARIVSASDARFSENVLTAVTKWRYAPPHVDGKSTCLYLTVPIFFRLEE